MRKSLLPAAWLSILFLPFKGITASLILFGVLLVLFISIKPIYRFGKSFCGSLGPSAERMSDVLQSALTRRAVPYLVSGLLLTVPFFAGNYLLDIAILTAIYAMLALGLNVIVGFTGLLNLGYVAFYAIGAYGYALLNVKAGFGFWQALPVCLVLTTLSGFVLAVPALRLKGDYLAIVTLGFGEIARLVLNNWDSLTNGPNGVTGIAVPHVLGFSLGSLDRYYYLMLLLLVFTYIVVKRVRASKVGRAWIAIREDEISASAMGIHTTKYKLYAMAFGSFWAGCAGVLFAAKMQFISPESFTFMESVLILCMVILGGLGSLPGVVVGALILVLLPEVLREVQSYRMLALGAGLIAMMIFRPQGFISSSGSSKG